MKRTLILGAGFGGITVATELRRRLGESHEVVLVDRGERFVMGLRKLWELVGIGTLEEGSRARARLAEKGIRFLRTEIESIDPAERRVVTAEGELDGDYLVVALGAEPRPDLVPGLVEHGHNAWDAAAIPALRDALAGFAGGRIAVVIAGVPYPCPPAPFECVMLLEEHLRGRAELAVATLQPILLPNAGTEGSAWLAAQLAERGIEFHTGKKPERVESGRVVFTEGALPFDLLIGVPPHRPPGVIRDSGLTGEGPWIPVDPGTLATSFDGVFAIGDVTHIPLANGLALPKAGLMAELEGKRVAAAIAGDAPAPFDGKAYCFLETGKHTASLIEGDFYATPSPDVKLRGISDTHAADKHRFESERLTRWFE